MGDERLRFDTLIALSTEPDHPLNVHVFNNELKRLAMPERDAQWSANLADSGGATSLADWAWNANQPRVTFARAELAAIQLAWFLTVTFHPLQDRARRCLPSCRASPARDQPVERIQGC